MNKDSVQESIIYFAQSLFRQNTEESILWDIAINCIEHLEFVDCVIYLLDEERDVLVQKAAFGPKSDKNERIVSPLEIPVGKGIVGSVCITGKSEIVHDVSQDQRYIVDDARIASEMTVPIVSPEGEILGVIDSEHPEVGFYEDGHIKVVETIASICAIKLICARAVKDIFKAKEEAEEAANAKSDFLNTMSHEIRTPLNAIIGLKQYLLNDQPKEEHKQDLSTLYFPANHLHSLINNILDFSKLEAEKVQLDIKEFDIKEVFEGLYRTYSTQCSNKGLTLNYNLPDLPFKVVGDSVKLNQILTNLLGNAIKFTDAGSVAMSAQMVNAESDEVILLFQVKDSGIGISEEAQTGIFEQFEQATENTSGRYGGTGLGLSICKKLVEVFGGEIGVKSELGTGSEFWFKLPLKRGSLKYKASHDPLKPEWRLNKLPGFKVLVVEDNHINQLVLSKFLDKWQVDYHIAENGKVALDKLEGNSVYDLILMDLSMPVMNGKEAAIRIRNAKDSYYHNLPIIAVTADISAQARQQALGSGMNDIVLKPIDPARLFSILKSNYGPQEELLKGIH